MSGERWTVAELKEEWREENWERKANGIPRITWATFSMRKSVYMRAGSLKQPEPLFTPEDIL